jgi:hypothetical protein
MAPKLEELFARSISAWEKSKPLPPLPPPPRRPARLTNFFLPSSPKLPPGSRSWTPPPPSPEAPPSLSGFTLSPKPPAPLSERSNLQREPSPVSKDIEERMALLVLENNHLRQCNRGLYQQNSGLRELVREYKECCEEANRAMGNIRAAREAMELIIQDVTANISTYETTRARSRRAERISSRNRKRFVDENDMGIEVDEVQDVTKCDMEEITVYPYNNMI